MTPITASRRYLRAIDIYETVARESMDSNLLKYSAKNYLLNAGICFLCLKDEVAMQNALDKYQVCIAVPL